MSLSTAVGVGTKFSIPAPDGADLWFDIKLKFKALGLWKAWAEENANALVRRMGAYATQAEMKEQRRAIADRAALGGWDFDSRLSQEALQDNPAAKLQWLYLAAWQCDPSVTVEKVRAALESPEGSAAFVEAMSVFAVDEDADPKATAGTTTPPSTSTPTNSPVPST